MKWKWISKDKSTMIDLDRVDFYHYESNILRMSVSGYEVVLTGDSAEEVYNKLDSSKSVL